MDNSNLLIQLLSPNGFVKFLGVITIALQLIYLIFAFIMVSQVKLMNKSFTTEIAPFFTFLALVHFFSTLILIFVSIVLLAI